jgi:hypothetical protein
MPTGGDAADGGPTLPGGGMDVTGVIAGRPSSMSLACGHAHLNSGITTARNVRKCTPGNWEFHALGI